MNLRPKRSDDLDVNITPLIDVVFLLLIFFMVSTTFERESEINITLPEASEEFIEPLVESLTVDVDAQGRIFINQQSLVNAQLRTIREALRDAIVDMNDPAVVINADAQATHQNIIKIMDAARQLGLVKITFATQRIKEEAAD